MFGKGKSFIEAAEEVTKELHKDRDVDGDEKDMTRIERCTRCSIVSGELADISISSGGMLGGMRADKASLCPTCRAALKVWLTEAPKRQ